MFQPPNTRNIYLTFINDTLGCFVKFCKTIYIYSEAIVIFCGLKQFDAIPAYTLEHVQCQRVLFLKRCWHVKAIAMRFAAARPRIARGFQNSSHVWLRNQFNRDTGRINPKLYKLKYTCYWTRRSQA
jgi:hypothetical protein